MSKLHQLVHCGNRNSDQLKRGVHQSLHLTLNKRQQTRHVNNGPTGQQTSKFFLTLH